MQPCGATETQGIFANAVKANAKELADIIGNTFTKTLKGNKFKCYLKNQITLSIRNYACS